MNFLLLIAVCASAQLSHGLEKGAAGNVHPVLLVPGAHGSRLEAKVDKKKLPLIAEQLQQLKVLQDNSDWYTIWFNPLLLLPGSADNWVDTFRLDVDEKTGKPVNRSGVEVRVPDFGGTDSVEYINPFKWLFGYMDKVVKSLLSLGYKRGVNIRGAPYDFRLAPNDNTEYLTAVKALVETMHKDAGNKSVILISHSTGSRYLYYFLSQQTPEWKARHVARWISIAGGFGGDIITLTTLSAGTEDAGVQGLSRDNARKLFRSFTNNAFGSPDPLAFGDAVIFQYKDKNFTAGNLSDIFQTIDHKEGVEQLKKTSTLIKTLDDPGVKVTCLRGTKTPTVELIKYADEKSLLDGAELIHGDGDGTMNVISSRVCERWSRSEGFESAEYEKVKHVDLLKNAKVLAQVRESVKRVNAEQ